MSSWSRHKQTPHVILYDHRVELTHKQFVIMEGNNWRETSSRIENLCEVGIFRLKHSIHHELVANPLFTDYVVARASIDGGVPDYYWDKVCLIDGPEKGKWTRAEDTYDYHTVHFAGKPALNGKVDYCSRFTWMVATHNKDYKIYISFPFKDQAMLFKLIYY